MSKEIDLLNDLRSALSADFDVVGFLGRSDERNVYFLARELVTSELVALRLKRTGFTADGQEEYEPSVVRDLDPSVPDPSPNCPRCSAPLRAWAKFCTQCRLELSGVSSSMSQQYSRSELLEAVQEYADGEYQVLGDMRRRDGAGFVYFALRRATGELVTLRLKREEGNQYHLAETRVIKPLPRSQRAAGTTSMVSILRPVEGGAAPRGGSGVGAKRSERESPPSRDNRGRDQSIHGVDPPSGRDASERGAAGLRPRRTGSEPNPRDALRNAPEKVEKEGSRGPWRVAIAVLVIAAALALAVF
ncbi:MAG: hypothetical protein IPK33_03015 [Gemmatimonadetes bacterium]|nr:hypothetical protein [Gemmatimonadota bacterium]